VSRKDTVGTTYLIHFDRPYRHVSHYAGWALDLEQRIADHREGKGARLIEVINEAGIGWEVVRTWPGTTRDFERHLKDTRHLKHYCPADQPERSAARREARRQQKEKDMPQTAPEKTTEKTTVGELVTGMQRGTYTRQAVAAAIRKLDVIQWDVEVDRPEPEIEDREMGA
jgi:predicted GIY-YIG superfamily endonuclease